MRTKQTVDWRLLNFLRLLLSAAVLLALLAPTSAGAASAPTLAFTPSAWDAGTIAPGAKAPQTFLLKNTGGTASASLKLAISGTGAAAFTITADGCSATSLGPNKSCSVTVSYSPAAAEANDTATLTAISNKPAATATASLSGKGTPANHAPVANNDAYTTKVNLVQITDRTISVGIAAGLLANDSDPDLGDQLTASLTSNPSHGTLALNADGSFTYTPAAAFIGTDSFTYQATDSHGAPSNTATVTIIDASKITCEAEGGTFSTDPATDQAGGTGPFLWSCNGVVGMYDDALALDYDCLADGGSVFHLSVTGIGGSISIGSCRGQET